MTGTYILLQDMNSLVLTMMMLICTDMSRGNPTEAQQCPSIVFKKQQESIISSYSWLLTVKIPFTYHQQFLQQLLNATVTIETQAVRYFEAMQQVRNATNLFWQTPEWYDQGMGTSTGAFHKSQATLLYRELKLLGLRVRQLVQDYNELTQIYLNLEDDRRYHIPKSIMVTSTQKRGKRWVSALLGVVSSGMGIASLVEIAGIQNHVRQLADRQNTLLKSQQDMWLILNQTLSSVNQNTQRIEALSNHLEHVVTALEDLLNRLANRVGGEMLYSMMSQTLQSSISYLHISVNKASDDLMMFSRDLRDSLNGKFPAHLLPRSQLKKITQQINRNLPDGLELGFDPAGRQGYINPVYMFASKDSVFVVLTMPVASVQRDSFMIYEVISQPFLRNSSEVVKLVLPEDTAGLAVNNDQRLYRLLSGIEMAACVSGESGQCTMHSPSYNLDNDKQCLIAYFLQRKDDIESYCRTTLMDSEVEVQANELTHNKYMLFSKKPRSLSIKCDSDIDTPLDPIRVPTGNSLVTVPEGCRASDSRISLVGLRRSTTEITSEAFLKSQLDHWQIEVGLFNISHLQIRPHDIRLPHLDLGPIEELPSWMVDTVEKWQSRLSYLDPLAWGKGGWLRIAIYMLIGAVALTGIVLIIIVICWYRGCCLSKLKMTECQTEGSIGNLTENIPLADLKEKVLPVVKSLAEKAFTHSDRKEIIPTLTPSVKENIPTLSPSAPPSNNNLPNTTRNSIYPNWTQTVFVDREQSSDGK